MRVCLVPLYLLRRIMGRRGPYGAVVYRGQETSVEQAIARISKTAWKSRSYRVCPRCTWRCSYNVDLGANAWGTFGLGCRLTADGAHVETTPESRK